MKKDSDNKEAKGGDNKDATSGAEDKQHDAEREVEREAFEARIAELEAENAALLAYKEEREAEDEERAKIDADRGLTINRAEEHQGGLVKPGARLYLNAKGNRLVPAGHKDAATLYCTEHDEVPRAELERLR